ncbi:MAG TPA: Ni/Fe-hydrogenase cytochrome b subunit [Candidatus Hydrogenedentes bacterium]|nr:Ni/Fe-hydrogenase cytochrome b subunit [Candidatus Hydrogenedentota bacterium]HOV73377.1 Ni/Fe-hydrogenase cytochrome b subunit [Candidatus Hydrogenedentota bacterium]
MSHHPREPISVKFWTPGVYLLCGIAAAGVMAALYRLVFGLQASTNLTDRFPWGIWIAYDVEGRVALSAGGFTMAALTHVFNRHKYEPIVRSALLVALLGYSCAVVGLLMDLGRYYNAWHPAMPWMWQGNSVLFEVGMCVMAYLTVLYLEFSPMFIERFAGRVNLPGPLSRLNRVSNEFLTTGGSIVTKIMFLILILGVVLSCMHQSALGSLILVAPYKTSPLWWTPVLPGLFLLSAIAVGFPMVIFEQLYAAWSFNRKPPMDLLGSLAKLGALFLGLYALAKISDFTIRGAFEHFFPLSLASVMLAIEVVAGVLVPLVMLVSRRVRKSPALLMSACSLIIAGIILNRLNVFLIAYRPPYMTKAYFPSLVEILVSLGLTATLILAYRAAVTIFPVLTRQDAAAGTEASHAK